MDEKVRTKNGNKTILPNFILASFVFFSDAVQTPGKFSHRSRTESPKKEEKIL